MGTPSSRTRAKSIVGDLLKYEISESPPWHTEGINHLPDGTEMKDVNGMIEDIISFGSQWTNMQQNQNFQKDKVESVLKDMTEDYVTKMGLHEDIINHDLVRCILNRTLAKPQDDVMLRNIFSTWKYLQKKVGLEEDKEELIGYTSEFIIIDCHKQLMDGITVKKGSAPWGKYSTNKRTVAWGDEIYEYPHLTASQMEKEIETLEARTNSLVEEVKSLQDEKDRLKGHFKLVAWFLFTFLDLHPFGDGNGRLGRLLSSYLSKSMCPFPTPIFNMWSSSTKTDYINALVSCRRGSQRHPCDLAAMLVECNWACWKHFIKKISSI